MLLVKEQPELVTDTVLVADGETETVTVANEEPEHNEELPTTE